MARQFGWPNPAAEESDWYALVDSAAQQIGERHPDLAAVYGERMDRWLVTLIAWRWVPDECLDASLRDEMATHMEGIERLPDRPIPASTQKVS